MIQRFPGERRGRCGAVVSGGYVYAVATDTSGSQGITEQTRQTLKFLEDTLNSAGSGKAGLVQATVYMSDISKKSEMDAVWCEWIGGEENWPQRACVGVELADDDLIEVVVVAELL